MKLHSLVDCRRQEQLEAQHRSNQQQLARKAAAAETARQQDAAFRRVDTAARVNGDVPLL